jgi:hypothetical protein
MFLGVAANGFLAEVEWLEPPWWRELRPPWLRSCELLAAPAVAVSERLLGLLSLCCLLASDAWLGPWYGGAEPRRCLLGNFAAMAGLLMALPSRMHACEGHSSRMNSSR